MFARPLLLLLLLGTGLTAASGPKKTIYDGLLRHLFENDTLPYRPGAMPICEPGGKLHVNQDMLLLQLFDLDEPTQMLTVDVWVESIWKDCRLNWDPAKFGGIDNFAIKASEIWFPDLLFFESLHGNFEEGMFIYGEATARIFSDGSVQLGTQAVFKIFCRVDISSFPYDSQQCNITFSSWTKDASTFVLTKKPSDESSSDDHAFQSASNGEWQVEGFPSFNTISSRQVGVDESGGRSRDYTEVVFQLRLKRKYLFYQAYMLFPCILLTWLTLFVFLLPAESGEKMGYVTTILLSLFVFLLLVADNIPRSGDSIPTVGVYFCLAIALVSLANVKAVISYNISLKGRDFCMPRNLKWLLSRSRFVGLRLGRGAVPTEESPAPDEGGGAASSEAKEKLNGTSDGHSKQDENQWRYLGIMLDRIFFIVYFFVNLAVTIWILSCGE
uniref:Neur_chan_LBD domain-containing protein n=1 Tax=Macrostomum lignano TaxID=282301 RepID=A0A1I8JJQ2_9PLAT